MDDATGIAALAGLLHSMRKIEGVEAWIPDAWRLPARNMESSPVIAHASRLAVGMRVASTDDRAASPQQLASILTSLLVGDSGRHPPAYWPLAPLELSEETLFPGEARAHADIAKRLGEMWDGLRRGAEQLKDAHAGDPDLPTYLESLLLLLQRFTWSMPSADHHARPDVSVYDHSRMTAALAAVLARRTPFDEALARALEAGTGPVALLVGGDVSGIQDFIYTISSRGATSALRGRSFYLQLLVEGVVRHILRRLDLPAINVIYASGGNFYLLARPADAVEVKEIQADVSRILQRHHGGALYVAVESLSLAGRDFFDGRISTAWRDLAERLQHVKQRCFAELGDALADVFEPAGHGGSEEKQCQVCGNEHPKTRSYEQTPENPEGVRKCPQCVSYEALGDSLRRADYLVLNEIEPAPAADAAGSYEEALAELGLRAEVLAQPPEPANSRVIRRTALALHDAALSQLEPEPHTAVGRRLVVNVTPTISEQEVAVWRNQGVTDLPEPNGVKPFDILERDASGIERLGVLRMDVDNLGRLFAEGLPTEERTLSRMAALSFATGLFFEGWVARIAEKYQREGGAARDRLYSIYSGGDDLFFVGSWDAVVEFAIEVRRDLGRFAAQHPAVHASAGIALIGGKYPLAQAADDAGRAEKQAKGLLWRKDGSEMRKDAVSFLGQALPWERFGLGPCDTPGIGNAHALMHRLHELTDSGKEGEGGAPAALIRQLIGLYRQYADAMEKRRERGEELNRAREEQVLWGPWTWRAFYVLSRMARRQDAPQLKDDVMQLRDQLQADQFRSIEYIGLAARWAELLLRRGQGVGEHS